MEYILSVFFLNKWFGWQNCEEPGLKSQIYNFLVGNSTVQRASRFVILKLVVFGFASLASVQLACPIRRAASPRAASPSSACSWLSFAAVSEVGNKLRIRYEFLLIFLRFRVLLLFSLS
jgi:hypothetical protein